MLEKLDVSGQTWLRQITFGFPMVGNLGEPGACPVDKERGAPELSLEELLRNLKNRIGARTAGKNRVAAGDSDGAGENRAARRPIPI